MKKDVKQGTENLASAKSTNLPISTKHGVEISNFLRYKTTSFAKSFLEEVIVLKKAVPFKKFNRDVGHKAGMAAGRYPQKAAKEFLRLIKSAESNAQDKGLDTGVLKIVKLLANKAAIPFSGGRRRQGTKRSHLEVEVKAVTPKKAKKEVKKVETKKVEATPVEKKVETVEKKVETPVEKKVKAVPVQETPIKEEVKVEEPVVKVKEEVTEAPAEEEKDEVVEEVEEKVEESTPEDTHNQTEETEALIVEPVVEPAEEKQEATEEVSVVEEPVTEVKEEVKVEVPVVEESVAEIKETVVEIPIVEEKVEPVREAVVEEKQEEVVEQPVEKVEEPVAPAPVVEEAKELPVEQDPAEILRRAQAKAAELNKKEEQKEDFDKISDLYSQLKQKGTLRDEGKKQ